MYDAHQGLADKWSRVQYGLGIPSVALAAVAGTSALSDFDHSNVVAGIFALAAAVLTALLTWLNPQELSQRHGHAAQAFLSLSLRARRLARRLDSVDDESLTNGLEALESEFDDLVAKSPNVSLRRITRADEDN
jgi:hypothetical protein